MSAYLLAVPICVFAKPPVAGRVKTRLASGIGAEAAAQLAQAMLCDTWTVVCSVQRATPILAAAEEGWLPDALASAQIWRQSEGDLGDRMERILQRGLQQAAAAIVLGADLPQLTGEHVDAAIDALETHDAVLGPSLDGGYYLLGLRRCPDGLLSGLPWSASDTRQKTEERLQANRFSIAALEPLADVDTAQDLASVTADLFGSELAPATRLWLDRHAGTLRSLPLG